MTDKLRNLARRVRDRGPRVSPRQAAGLLGTAVIGGCAAASAVAGRAAVATCLLTLLLAGALAGVVHLSRRIGGVNRSTQDSVAELRIVVEQLQRRVIASVEKERLAAGDRHQEITDTLARTERLTGRGAELLLREQSREIEALVQLFQQVTPRAPMPGGGVLNPTDLLGLIHTVRSRRPRLTVALGSGPSTIWLAYAVTGDSRVIAVDHDPGRAAQTSALLTAHTLPASVLCSPLAELTVDAKTIDWYDVESLATLHDIDLLIVDSALAPSAGDAVAAALHVLGRRLSPTAAVLVDTPAEEANAVPRQGGFGLTAQHRLAGRWTTLTRPHAPISA